MDKRERKGWSNGEDRKERDSERDRERDGLSRAAMQRTGRRRIKGWKDAERITGINASALRNEMYSCLKCERRIGQKKERKKERLLAGI